MNANGRVKKKDKRKQETSSMNRTRIEKWCISFMRKHSFPPRTKKRTPKAKDIIKLDQDAVCPPANPATFTASCRANRWIQCGGRCGCTASRWTRCGGTFAGAPWRRSDRCRRPWRCRGPRSRGNRGSRPVGNRDRAPSRSGSRDTWRSRDCCRRGCPRRAGTRPGIAE